MQKEKSHPTLYSPKNEGIKNWAWWAGGIRINKFNFISFNTKAHKSHIYIFDGAYDLQLYFHIHMDGFIYFLLTVYYDKKYIFYCSSDNLPSVKAYVNWDCLLNIILGSIK